MARTVGAKDRVSRKHAHCFSRQFLEDHGIKMYRGNDQILGPVPHLYTIKLPNTRYFVGEQFVEFKGSRKIFSYEVLRNMGFLVCSVKLGPADRWDKNQQVMYILKRISEMPENPLTSFPSGKFPLYAEHDPFNKQIRLIGPRAGPMGYGQWVRIEEDKDPTFNHGGGREMSYKGYSKNSSSMIDDQIRNWLDIEEDPEPIYIKEAAFMITDANEIVCFPVKQADMPSILISGMKGTGKSYCLHSIVSRLFWKPEFDYKIVILNDSSRETGTWCFPNSDPEQIMILKRLNERPLPLPTVYLHPKVKEDYETLFMGDTGFYITIPFKEVIDNHKDYLSIEGSARYFTKFKEQLKHCKSEQEAQALLDTISIAFNVPQQTAVKIRAELDTLFDTKMTDISSKKQHPWRTSLAPERQYNPLTACIHAGVLPVLETEFVSNYKSLLSIYFTYFVKDLFMRQKQDPDFSKTQSELLLVIDEAHNISKRGEKTGADALLRRCVREGRPRRIGTLLATQKFGELPDVIKDNSTYLICFKNPGEANLIANQYKMGKGVANMITDLDKHECIAYTTEYFIVYDSYGRRRKTKANEVLKGRVLPPYSLHKRPKAK